MAAIGAAVLVRNIYLSTAFGSDAPLLFLIFPIVLAAWVGDWKSGMMTTFVGVVVGVALFVERDGLHIVRTLDLMRLLRYIVAGGMISALFEGMYAARRSYRASAEESARRQQRLALVSENLRLVTDNMEALISRCTKDLRYVWVSRPYAEWIRRRVEEINGRAIEEILGPEAFAQLRPYFDQVLAGQRVQHEIMVDIGSLGKRWVSAVYSPTFDASGATDGWVAVVNDVTARKRIEEELEAGSRRKDEFLALMAHELRNPLAPISNSLQMLEHVENSPADVARLRAVMERQLQHMIRIVDDLLDVSRITRGKIQLRKACMDVCRAVRDAIAAVRPLIDQEHQRLSVALPLAPLTIEGDCDRLTQVFANVLHNASKYSGPGGAIWVEVEQQTTAAVVRIRDEGVGIPRHMQAEIFEMFRQADQSSSRSHGGLGIGLTVVKEIVEMHGGTVTVASEGAGEGSEFVVTLPAKLNSSSEVREDAPSTTRALQRVAGRRLLVVDDFRESAESLARLLQLRGHEVRLAFDGPSAIESVLADPPEIALIDIGMPRMDGYELARRLRARTDLPRITLVALTGYLGDNVQLAILEAGFDHYLAKPAKLQELERLLGEPPDHTAAAEIAAACGNGKNKA